MERPTTEVILPISSMKAIVYTYFTRGERKAIEAIMLESAVFEQKKGEDPKLKSIDTTYRSRMEDKAVLLAVKSLTGKDGKVVELKTEILDNLPEEDFNALHEAVPSGQLKKK